MTNIELQEFLMKTPFTALSSVSGEVYANYEMKELKMIFSANHRGLGFISFAAGGGRGIAEFIVPVLVL